jgi:hypothetical protein
MSGGLSVEFDPADIARLRGVPGALFRVLRASGSDAVRFLRTGSNRLIRQRKRFKASTLNRAMTLEYPSRARDIEGLEWKLNVSGAPVPLAEFPHRQTAKGVSVGINVSKRTLIKSAFVATMASGHEGVFEREGKSRLPISELYSTRVTDVFQDAGFADYVFQGAQIKFQTTFDRLIGLELGKLGAE